MKEGIYMEENGDIRDSILEQSSIEELTNMLDETRAANKGKKKILRETKRETEKPSCILKIMAELKKGKEFDEIILSGIEIGRQEEMRSKSVNVMYPDENYNIDKLKQWSIDDLLGLLDLISMGNNEKSQIAAEVQKNVLIERIQGEEEISICLEHQIAMYNKKVEDAEQNGIDEEDEMDGEDERDEEDELDGEYERDEEDEPEYYYTPDDNYEVEALRKYPTEELAEKSLEELEDMLSTIQARNVEKEGELESIQKKYLILQISAAVERGKRIDEEIAAQRAINIQQMGEICNDE